LLKTNSLWAQSGNALYSPLPVTSRTFGQFPPPPSPKEVEVSQYSSPAVAEAKFNSVDSLEGSEFQDSATVEQLLKRSEKLENADKTKRDGETKKKEDEAAKKKADEAKKIDSGWTDVSDDKWTVKLGGHVQMDYVNWASASPSIVGQQDYFEFRRLRLVADGTGYGVYDFRLQMTLEPETVGESPPGVATSPDVKDAYLSINESGIFLCRSASNKSPTIRTTFSWNAQFRVRAYSQPIARLVWLCTMHPMISVSLGPRVFSSTGLVTR
jgi:hypothetical protein